MDKSALEQLATFLGHTEKTHSEFYRLPDDLYQVAKVSKLLMLSNRGSIERYKGKKLDEIERSEEIIENEDSDNEEDEICETNGEINVTLQTETPTLLDENKTSQD
ncbi:hypothetical protein NQ314_001509 [Rhamnusium bicolor]|uniref:Uncharacterized protein n=1 Tax=Rhamnusium bicolor TaxID=1586634 RepID=A0AAV8ZS45_9CUCU|nr:hypothetical protein NQ314_001509 [Rhamnusium bicolor]